MSMRRLGWCGLLFLAACAGRARDANTSEVGTLGLQLRTEVNHVAYRLRDGVFEVTGPQVLTLGTEDDVNAASLEGTLAVGAYDIELLPGWRLERESASGFETLVAELTSDNPLSFEIEPGQRTNLHYDFFTDGTRIGLGDGGFEVSIGVTDTSQPPGNPAVFDAAACDFVNTTGCEQLTCERACPINQGSFCLVVCENILDCVSQQPCSTESDPLCAVRTPGQLNICTNVVEPGGGPNTTNATMPAFVARSFVECACSVPRPGAGSAGCSEGQLRACGPSADVGVCRRGVETCSNGAFSACQGAVLPSPRDCTSALDNDCDGLPDNTIDASCPAPLPSFERDIWPIFQGQCSPCHTTLGRGGHLVGSADLATAFADATRLGTTLIDRLDGGGMPPACTGVPGDPGCISVEDLVLIELWLDTGMSP
jgi:hypothetical protein